MYTNTSNNMNEISIHDCAATGIEKGSNSISFYFSKGFYCILKDKTAVHTSEGEMEITFEEEDITFFVFRPNRRRQLVREDCTAEFISRVNSGEWRCEFFASFQGYHRILLQGAVFFDKAPYSMDFELDLSADSVSFSWNT